MSGAAKTDAVNPSFKNLFRFRGGRPLLQKGGTQQKPLEVLTPHPPPRWLSFAQIHGILRRASPRRTASSGLMTLRPLFQPWQNGPSPSPVLAVYLLATLWPRWKTRATKTCEIPVTAPFFPSLRTPKGNRSPFECLRVLRVPFVGLLQMEPKSNHQLRGFPDFALYLHFV